MKLKDEFVITDFGESSVLVPVGKMAESLHGIIRINETAAFIVKQLQESTTAERIVDALFAEYDVERSDAENHVNAVLNQLKEIDALVD